MKPILDISVEGPSEGVTLVFIHGWPDSARLWDQQVAALVGRYRCVRVTLPNFSTRRSPDGFDFSFLVERLAETISGLSSVVLIGHDWGAYLAYFYERQFPERVLGLITMDVGARLKPNNFGEALFFGAYQAWLISAWFIGKLFPDVGTSMSRGLARLGGAPFPSEVSFEMNYPYFYFWRNLLLESSRFHLLMDYEPRCPTLYLYGERKPVMFHSAEWLSVLERLPSCRSVGIARAGHWLMIDQPAETNRLMIEWLEQHHW